LSWPNPGNLKMKKRLAQADKTSTRCVKFAASRSPQLTAPAALGEQVRDVGRGMAPRGGEMKGRTRVSVGRLGGAAPPSRAMPPP
jgi:hypothetical protein